MSVTFGVVAHPFSTAPGGCPALTFTLILANQTETDPEKRLVLGRASYFLASAHRAPKILIIAVLFAAPQLLSATTLTPGAGSNLFETFFSHLFGNSAKAQEREGTVSLQNSQNIALLQAARNIDPNPSRGGGEVVVVDNSALRSESGPSGTAAEVVEAPKSGGQISLYIVREGDSLSQIADMFDVSVSTIVWANDLPSSRAISPGQTLLILPVSGVQHKVKKGDTLKAIAAKYGGDVDEILEYNNLDEGASLAVGTTITIPGGEVKTSADTPSSNAASRAVARSGGPSVAGYFTHPLPGSIKTQGIHGYNAIDLGASHGTPILAAANGSVIVSRSAGWNGGYGNYIVIDHPNGTQTLYAHLSSNIVSSGQNVVQGQVIGYVGSTGRSTGNHLHFEVRGAKNPF